MHNNAKYMLNRESLYHFKIIRIFIAVYHYPIMKHESLMFVRVIIVMIRTQEWPELLILFVFVFIFVLFFFQTIFLMVLKGALDKYNIYF